MGISAHDARSDTPPRSAIVRRVAIALCVACLLALLVIASGTERTSPQSDAAVDDDPSSCCRRMIAAEMAGDVEAYLDCFAGELRGALEARMATKSPAERGAELRSHTIDLTGHAIIELELAGANGATLVLQRIYTRDNGREVLELRRTDGTWQIVEMRDEGRAPAQFPYGTLASPVSGTIGPPISGSAGADSQATRNTGRE